MAETIVSEQGLDLRWLEDHVSQELEAWSAPGLEVVVVKDGETLFAGGFGRRRLDPDQPVTENTIFAHGSTGKAFTGFLVGTLVDEGVLDWDKPVREYVPSLRLSDSTVADRVTLRDLLSHRSGLPRHDLAWIANPSWTRSELVSRLRHLPLSKDLRETWQYSNLGFVLAGHAVETVTGSTFGEQLRRRIFDPIGFERTYVDTAEVLALADVAEPYRVEEGKVIPIPRRPLDNAAPAGGIMSCARDTARWLRLHLAGGEIDGKRLLSEASFRETHALQMPVALATGDEEYGISGYAFGWGVGTYRGRKLRWHNGGIDGFYTEFMLLPDDGIAVATCNNAGEPVSLTVARSIVDHLLGADAKDWSAEAREQRDKAKAAGAGARPKSVPGTSPSQALEQFAGVYEHPGYGAVEFEVAGGALTARAGVLQLESKHRHYDTWELSPKTMSDLVISATFYTGPDGAVGDVFLPLEPTVDPIHFRRRADAALSDPEFLRRLVGTYDGVVRIEVSLSPAGKLLVAQSGQEAELVPAGTLSFTVAGMPAMTVEFELDENGRGRSLSTQGVALTRTE